jgi:hypothetical protein
VVIHDELNRQWSRHTAPRVERCVQYERSSFFAGEEFRDIEDYKPSFPRQKDTFAHPASGIPAKIMKRLG